MAVAPTRPTGTRSGGSRRPGSRRPSALDTLPAVPVGATAPPARPAVAHPDVPVGVCAVCRHVVTSGGRLGRLERGARRLFRAGPARCGAEPADVHEASAWGEPPCACTAAVHGA